MVSLVAAEEGGLVVDHVLIDCEDLAARPLGEWIAGLPQATHLLDPETGQTHAKVCGTPLSSSDGQRTHFGPCAVTGSDGQ